VDSLASSTRILMVAMYAIFNLLVERGHTPTGDSGPG